VRRRTMTTSDPVDSFTHRHITLSLDNQRLAWLRIDMADSTVNRLSTEVMQELGQVLEHLAAHPPAGLVFYSGKDSGFIAGADIDEFSGVNNAEQGQRSEARRVG